LSNAADNRVLITGSGAREHALAWKLAQSPLVADIFVAPGNPGTAQIATNVSLSAADAGGILTFVRDRNIDLTVIGPEASLAAGVQDVLRSAGHAVVGPSAAAFRLEGSKALAKQIMAAGDVPTAAYASFDDVTEARQYVAGCDLPVVVKVDGLAAGKGVTICHDRDSARRAVDEALADAAFGVAGSRILIEEFLSGPEVSLICLVDGENVVPFPLAQDHKRLLDGDAGPNTGGMGAYSPVPFVAPDGVEQLTELTVRPVIRQLAEMGTPYRGVLFAGLMLTEHGAKVLEYNCRFGDPEAEAILPIMTDDLFPLLKQVAVGRLSNQPVRHDGYAAAVVLAASGYPASPRSGDRIEGMDGIDNGPLIFHAGTTLSAGEALMTAGGRVLAVVGQGSALATALDQAYASPVAFAGMQHRSDIGQQALAWLADRQAPNASTDHSPEMATDLPRIVVLASGSGSNLRALVEAQQSGNLQATIEAVVSHETGAGSLEIAAAAGIPRYVVEIRSRRDPAARDVHERKLAKLIDDLNPDLVVLAGWMLILSPALLDRVGCPILNVHPALLPMEEAELIDIPIIRGARAVRDAIQLRVPYTGVSVHRLTADVDAGPVICRERVEVLPADTEESLYARIKPVEHRLLVDAIRRFTEPSRRLVNV
jgi:phosphoribosylamine--glycine ligase